MCFPIYKLNYACRVTHSHGFKTKVAQCGVCFEQFSVGDSSKVNAALTNFHIFNNGMCRSEFKDRNIAVL